MQKIYLTQGQVAIVDDEDYEELSAQTWCASAIKNAPGKFYAMRQAYGRTIMMHAQIARTPKGFETDHVNKDTLDNRSANLRVCSTSQNQANRSPQKNNTSGFKGVTKRMRGGMTCWHARISYQGKSIHIGIFTTLEEAARAYDLKASALFGEFAYLNLP